MKIFLYTMIMISIIIPFLLLMLNKFISKTKMLNQEKNSTYECGFNSNLESFHPFSIQFFLISIIFLIFDIEISIIIPSINMIINSWWLILIITFLNIIILSLMLEWLDKSINWKF